MSRSFLMLSLLKEADTLDVAASSRQARNIRNLNLLSRGQDYVHVYRLTEELISNLEEELRPLLTVTAQKGRGLANRIKLLSTLSFLANGSYQKILGKNVNTFLSQASISRSLHLIVNVLNHPIIVKKYIRFPQNAAERQALKEKFYEKFNIPGVIGCIDGTLVAMIRPKENEERYFCRKGYHARNVLLITDADLNIIHVDASYGGASHDSFVFSNSQIKCHLEEVSNAGEIVYLLAALQATVSSSSHHGRDRSRSRSPSRGTPLDNVPPSGSSHSETSNAESSHDGAPRRQRNFKISHILIKHKKSRRPVDANDKPVTRTRDQAMSMMIDIHDQIAKDLITFADAAFAFSECASARRQGDIQKHFETGRVKQNFEDTAIALAPGQMSKVIESTSGYHILQRRE